MRDKFNRVIVEGDPIVYAVRTGNTARLGDGIAHHVWGSGLKVRNASGRLVTLNYGDRIAIIGEPL